MENMPPKTLEKKLVHLDNNLKQIERKQVPGIQRAPGSLPVLEAFQEFLEVERQKSRKKLLLVTIVYSLLVLMLVAGGAAFIYIQMKRAEGDYSKLVERTQAIEGSIKSAAEGFDASLAGLEERSVSRSDLSQGISQAQSNLEEKVTQAKSGMDDVQKSIEQLRRENESLKAELRKVVADWHSLAKRGGNISAEPVRRQGLPEKEVPAKTVTGIKPKPKLQMAAKFPEAPVVVDTDVPVKPENHIKTAVRQKPSVVAENKSGADEKPVSPRKVGARRKSRQPSASLQFLIRPVGSETGIRWRLPKL
jgi:FtsZ-binding cell division protein ZapB